MNATRNEVWLPVVGFEGRYNVSSLGRVRSLDRTVEVDRAGCPYTRRSRGCVLKTPKNSSGYPHVVLEGNADRTVHELVLEAFVGSRPPGAEGCHSDDVKTNNTPENLYWGTKGDNARDCIRNGNHNHASKTHCIHRHQLTGDNVRVTPAGHRVCRECQRRRKEDWKRRRAT